MIHSSLKLWWDAEWKQMRACQTWQEKLISSQPLAGFWFKRSGVSVPSPQPSTAARTVMGSHRCLWGAFVSASSNRGGTLSQRDPKQIFISIPSVVECITVGIFKWHFIINGTQSFNSSPEGLFLNFFYFFHLICSSLAAFPTAWWWSASPFLPSCFSCLLYFVWP